MNNRFLAGIVGIALLLTIIFMLVPTNQRGDQQIQTPSSTSKDQPADSPR